MVLIVDDEPTLLTAMARLLRRRGLTVLMAGDATAALRLLEEWAQPVNLLITDLRLPDLPGAELGRLVLSRGLARRVLFVSGMVEEDARGPGIAPVLAKPFRPGELGRTVELLLQA